MSGTEAVADPFSIGSLCWGKVLIVNYVRRVSFQKVLISSPERSIWSTQRFSGDHEILGDFPRVFTPIRVCLRPTGQTKPTELVRVTSQQTNQQGATKISTKRCVNRHPTASITAHRDHSPRSIGPVRLTGKIDQPVQPATFTLRITDTGVPEITCVKQTTAFLTQSQNTA